MLYILLYAYIFTTYVTLDDLNLENDMVHDQCVIRYLRAKEFNLAATKQALKDVSQLVKF